MSNRDESDQDRGEAPGEDNIIRQFLRQQQQILENSEDPQRTLPSGNTHGHRRERSNLPDLFVPLAPPAKSPPFPPNRKVAQPPRASPPPPPPPPAALPKPSRIHNRQVSWGQDVNFDLVRQSPPQSPTSNTPSLDSKPPSLERPAEFRLERNRSDASHRRRPSNASVRLEQILQASPLEHEAETHILHAIEQRARADTASSLLSNVPDQHPFDADNDSLAGTSESDSVEMQPLTAASPKTPVAARKSHRRHQSVEQALSGLTTALSERDLKPQHNTNPDGGSADALAHNCVILSNMESKRKIVLENLPTLEENDDEDDDPEAGQISSHYKSKRQSMMAIAQDKFRDDWEVWRAFFRLRRSALWAYCRTVMMYLILPATGIAAILFYLAGNPPTGESVDDSPGAKASASWWLLFVCVRQVLTFSLALATQAFVIDFLALGTRVLLYLLGPILTLLLVQAKGWPFIVLSWAIFDFALLSGTSEFARHWAHWQDLIDMFNEANPSGNVISNSWNTRVLLVAMSVSIVVAIKRFVIGLYLGRKTFERFGMQLAKVMNKMLLLSDVALLAKRIERAVATDDKIDLSGPDGAFPQSGELILPLSAFSGEDDDKSSATGRKSKHSLATLEKVIDTSARDPLTGSLHRSEKMKLLQLLDEWEEPDRKYDGPGENNASISAVLKFRKALTFVQRQYPFSRSFGRADNRTECIESSQSVFLRLMKATPESEDLPFDTIALLALSEDGELDQDKAKELVRLLRPDRRGRLSMLDFVKSVDAVYKEFRLLEASIENSSQIDRSFEQIFNVVFYAVVTTVVLSQLGFDPLALFLSLSSVILAFAFMIGNASAKYFEGLLFILARRPYSIGDRIHVSNVERDTDMQGSPGWVVEHVTLFETIAVWGPTQERCSMSNGSLASSRIINGARSPRAQFWIFLKFPIETEYDRILILKSAVEEYLKARPREWLALTGFRANKVAVDQGWIEYAITIRHRESWQHIGQLLDSKANFVSYCHEVAKQLNMHYKAPPLPVDLRYNPQVQVGDSVATEEDMNTEERTEAFRSLALHKHNIRLN